MGGVFDFNDLPDDERVAYFGSMFAVASADGDLEREEMALLFESLDQEGLSEAARATLRGYLVAPPELDACLDVLALGRDEVRYGTMVALLDIALADDVIDVAETRALEDAQRRLRVTEVQMTAISRFVADVKQVRERGIDDDTAAESLKRAASRLTGVGIPVAAVYFSGTVVGLSAAGISSGLAALGLGLGVVPGLGVAILLGTAAYYGAGWFLDKGNKRKKAALEVERARRAELVIGNLEDAIKDLVGRIAGLQSAASTAAGTNLATIEILQDRLRALQQLLARRKGTIVRA